MMETKSITQKYIRRYPNSAKTRAWARKMVQIQTENGIWREGGSGYTWPNHLNAWLLPFEEAMKQVNHCGPEKQAAFLEAPVRPILSVVK